MPSQLELTALAETATVESDLLDFKREFSPEKKSAFWAETIKDIVAFANTNGGIIVFGVEDDGTLSDSDCGKLFELDSAALADQIKKYTNFNFQGVQVLPVVRERKTLPSLVIEAVDVPIVFTKVGTYQIADGKQKTAFSLGTIYFRHASKSEPATRDDLQEKIQRNLEKIRDEWLQNIRKVVEAEPGSSVVVTKPSLASSSKIRVTSDPDAPLARIQNLSDGYPHRQSDVLAKCNDQLSLSKKLNSHDIQAIKLFESIDPTSTPQYVHKPHAKSSPQYTDEFIEFIVSKCRSEPKYPETCRSFWKTEKNK